MAKFVNMRVSVPVDDRMPVGLVYRHTREMLQNLGTVTLELPPGQENGEADSLLPDATPVARVHWPAVDVIQMVDRAAPQTSVAKPVRRTTKSATD